VSIAEILSHPLSLLLIGATVSGLLIPYFTNRWQRHQKGLEIRIDLVGRISQTVMSMMTMIDPPIRKESSEEKDKEIREFKVNGAVIGTELHAYFPSSACQGIGDKWDALTKVIELLTQDIELLTQDIESFNKSMKAYNGSIVTQSGGEKWKTTIKRGICDRIYDKKLEIILLVLDTRMPRFSLLPGFLHRLFHPNTMTKFMYQDPVKVAPDIYKVLREYDSVRILKVQMKQGAKSEMHSHTQSVAIVLNDQRLKSTFPNGKSHIIDLKRGHVQWLDALSHSVENAGTEEVTGVLVELKKRLNEAG